MMALNKSAIASFEKITVNGLYTSLIINAITPAHKKGFKKSFKSEISNCFFIGMQVRMRSTR